jgi:hypothetical protein
VRSITRDALKNEKRKINKAAQPIASERPTKSSSKASGNNSKGEKMVSTDKGTSSTSKKAGSKKTTRSSTAKKPVITKSRKKKLALQAEQAKKESVSSSTSVPKTRPQLNAGVTKAANSAHNREMHAKATEIRKKVGGADHYKGHVSARGKRSQARRDSR